MAKRTPSTTPSTTTTTTTTTTPSIAKFREIDATQLLTHIKKMDSIHTVKNSPRKFAGFVNLTVNEIAEILTSANVDNVNHGINLFVNGKSVDGVNEIIANGTVSANIIRKK